MGCSDPLLTALKDYGYNIVRLPRTGIEPLQILSRRSSNLDILGDLKTVMQPGPALPGVTRDQTTATVAGRQARTGALEAGIGLGFLSSIIKALGGQTVDLEGKYSGARSVNFSFLDVTQDSVQVAALDQYLAQAGLDPNSRHIGRLFQSDGLYVLTATLKSKRVKVEAVRSSRGELGLELPQIQGLVGGNVKVSQGAEGNSSLIFEGEQPLIFGFQAVQVRAEGGQYHALRVVEPGSVAARAVEGRAIVAEVPSTKDPNLVVLDAPRSPFVRITDEAAGSGPAAGRRALVIGINDYKLLGSSTRPLHGCVNDAEAMAATLREQFGFADKDIELLIDARATRQAILDGLDRLVERTAPGDLVVIHYSGHGSKVPDIEHDETDGFDETIVPYDSGRDPHPNRDITDDEIFERLRKLSAKTDAITLIFDSCHSGSISRDTFGESARWVEPDLRPFEQSGRPRPSVSQETIDALKAGSAAGSRDVGPSGFLPIDASYVLIAGCRDEQQSYEYLDRGSDTRHGVLTYFLLQEIATAEAGTTYRDVFERAAANVRGVYANQEPQIEGAADRELFGTRDLVPMRHVLVKKVTPRSLTLEAGAAHGVTVGSTWTIYPQGTKRIGADTPNLGTVKIQTVHGLTSEAAPTSVPDLAAIRPGSRAVETEHAGPPLSLTVEVQDLARDMQSAAAVSALKAALGGSELVRLVERSEADLRIYALPEGDEAAREGAAPAMNTLPAPSWGVVGRDGLPAMPVIPLDEPDAPGRLLGNLETIARYRNFLSIRNSDPDNLLYGKVDLLLLRRRPDGSWVEAAPSADGRLVFEEGESIGLRIVNLHDEPIYVTVLDFGLSYAVGPLFPPPNSQPKLEAKRTFDYGTDPARVEIQLGMPQGFDRTEGLETFKLIATTEPTDFRVFQQGGVRDDLTPMEWLLQQANLGTRDAFTRVSTPENWITIERAFTLKRP